MAKDLPQRIKALRQLLHWDWLPQITAYAIEQATALQQIPAPTFSEQIRAQYIQAEFEVLALEDVEADELFNVYGRIKGQNPALPAILVTAHSDTVFPNDTDLSLRRDKGTMIGPGLGDNCFGVSGMLALVAAFQELGHLPECDVWIVATSREEGMGNLGGMKAAYKKLADRVDKVVNLEGLAFGHIYHAAIAVRRLHIIAQAQGGHSWLHFGRSSAVHGILELGSQILRLEPLLSPRTTFNVGMIDGGQGINVIATTASMWLDLRSEDAQALSQFEDQVRSLVVACGREDLHFRVEVVGDRPAGHIDPNHELVRGALTALDLVGVRGTLETGSTDANIPLAAGCPAITIGITRGGNAHRLDEYVELEPVSAGLRQLVLLVMALSSPNNA